MDLLMDKNDAGSKEEKISIIIQNMGHPISALKALSFINLMFYSSSKESHMEVDRGCRI